jgi:glucose/arabinose dehydrogenase
MPVPLRDAVCSPQPGPAGYPCSARLPHLTSGRHVLQLATADRVDGATLESVRSAPIVVDMSASSSTREGGDGSADRFIAGGVAYQVHTVANDLTMPVALAAIPDGRLIAAERSGIVKIIRPGQEARIAVTIDDVGEGGRTIVHGVAVHSSFAQNGFVFVLYTSAREDDAVMRLVRFREVNDTLGEPAVMLDNLPADADQPAGAMALAAADEVFVATGVAADRSTDSPLAEKILRYHTDGTVPRDAPAASPVYAETMGQPLGVGVNSLSGRLWVLSRRRTGAKRLEIVSSPAGRAALQYRGDLLAAFTNHLVVAGAEGLQRFRYDAASGTWTAEELLLSGSFGTLGAVAEGADGALYIATANAASTGTPAIDRVLRLVPDDERARGRR